MATTAEQVRVLESEIQTLKAQAEAAALNNEQTYQALEQRYLLLSKELSQANRERNQVKVSRDNSVAELATLKADFHQLNLKLVALQRENEHQKVEIRELHTSRRDLLHRNEHKSDELAEKNSTIKSYLEKILRLADERSEMEGRFSEAQRAQRAAETMQNRLEQEKERLKHHSDWLDKELTQKSEVLLEQRRSASDEVLNFRQQILESETKTQALEHQIKELEERNRDVE
mmetsp:Transcript_43072/g.71794  ORF Transcript_43072/g.71794 Transcript_43072/m.71794 type:complete len:231 (-) Transcript_43072:2-694(-)